jgi:hypothetical protein
VSVGSLDGLIRYVDGHVWSVTIDYSFAFVGELPDDGVFVVWGRERCRYIHVYIASTAMLLASASGREGLC